MATAVYKVLGQSAPSATTETDLYTVPAATETIVSSIVVANRGTTSATFRISISVNGAATATKDYLYYDVNLLPNNTAAFTLGLSMDATDKIRVYASTANLSFSVYGSEIA
jgi:hypothetical protein